MLHRIWLLAFLLVCLLPRPGITGKIYRYTDAEGVTTFSELPPPAGESGELIRPLYFGTDVKSEQSQKKLESLVDNLDARAKDREFKSQYTKEEQDREKRRKENCEIARQNLRILETASRVRNKGPDGNLYFIDDNEKQQKITETKEQIKTFCD
jgi:hypothetical protein